MADRETLRPVAVIGAGLDLGAGRRGVDMGPSAIRYAGLQERIEGLGRVCVDWGDVGVGLPEATEVGDPRARYLESIKRSCARVASLVQEARDGGYLPLVLGGDHSIAIGTLGGLARAGPSDRANQGVSLSHACPTMELRVAAQAQTKERRHGHPDPSKNPRRQDPIRRRQAMGHPAGRGGCAGRR